MGIPDFEGNAHMISRRMLLSTGLGAAVVSLLAACNAPAPPAAPTAQAQPPTAAPAPTAVSQAAQPAAAGKPDLGKLVGKLEGATIVTDAAQLPKAFHEAPMLAELVKQGQLPPVDQRLPAEPMVLKPPHEIGRYGGTWRRASRNPIAWRLANKSAS